MIKRILNWIAAKLDWANLKTAWPFIQLERLAPVPFARWPVLVYVVAPTIMWLSILFV